MPKSTSLNVEAGLVSLPRIALINATGTTAWLFLSDAVSRYLGSHFSYPLNVTVVNGLVLGILLTPFSYLVLRHRAREAGGTREASHDSCSIFLKSDCICQVKQGAFLGINDGFTTLTRYGEAKALDGRMMEHGPWRLPSQNPAQIGDPRWQGELLDAEGNPAEEKTESSVPSEHMIDVAQPTLPVSPQDRIINVLNRFQLDKDLTVLPVVEDVAVVGIVNRSTFLEEHIIGRHGFAAHINHAKKIRELMEPMAFSFDAAMPVDEAAKILQPMISTLRIDNICITRNGAYVGVIDVNRFIKAMTDIQIVLAKGANPLTGLPGNTSIEQNICDRLNSNTSFDIAYIDIDNFKPFNDHYGFQKGDEVIKALAEIITGTSASSPLAASTFCGHIGGDDFILITESLQAEQLSALIIAAFEGNRLAFHGPKDQENGSYHAYNRKGELENFPLISLSVGIVNTSHSLVGSYAKLASLSTEVKKAAKMKNGSSIVVDRRMPPCEQI